MVNVNEFKNQLLTGRAEHAARAEKGKAHARQVLAKFMKLAEAAKEVYPERIKIEEPKPEGYAFRILVEVDGYPVAFITQPGNENVDIRGLDQDIARIVPQQEDRRSNLARALHPGAPRTLVSPAYFDTVNEVFAMFIMRRLQSR